MLSCGRGIGQISRITRHAYPNCIKSAIFEFTGKIGSLRHASNNKINKPVTKQRGTTIRAEECVPPKFNEKSMEPSSKSSTNTCPPECEEICGKIPPKGPSENNNAPKYWKHIITVIIVAGVAIYTYTRTDWMNQENEGSILKTPSKKKKENEKVKKTVKARYPVSSVSLPTDVPYLLIGGGTAAFSAFRSIKSRDPKAKVLVITNEPDHPYMRPPLSKELWYNKDRETSAQLTFRQWNGTERSLYYEPPEFYANVDNLMKSDKGGVAVATGWTVKNIDPFNRIAILDDGYEIKYDKCLIATGTSPKNLSIFENADESVKSKVIPFRTKDDFLELEERLADPKVKNVVIVGGGFLGSELACSLSRNLENTQKHVYQIYKEKFIMAQVLPEYLSEWTTKRSTMEGVTCVPNVEIENYEVKKGQLNLILNNGKTIEADQVVVAVGVTANTQLAEPSNLEIDPETGGFLVNAELEARSNLWVAGDAACFYDVKLGRRRVEHHDHAVISGRLAGENMTGAGKPYLHQSMFWSDLGPDVGYEAIGIVDSSLPTVGVFAKAEDKHSNVKTDTQLSNDQSKDEESAQNISLTNKGEQSSPIASQAEQDYGKGIIFYLRNDTVVGIVLWNIFNRMSVARQVLARGTHYEDLNEIAKLFAIHEE
ncbi:apoptosis-inducing factor 1, mitochondrial [Diachasma alloeum]|uniref:apoptosis-inducing factor 1, mitochondrial n=1 Tax=Diachasma alloeum TaxID=454923 RepID=UPI0007380F6F|nr:apoptosis-inducing factor 1, mitochondrial [Diachasma alloeum]